MRTNGKQPSGRAAGISLGRALDIPAGFHYEAFRRAVDAIDIVHGDGEIPVVAVKLVRRLDVRGRFHFDSETGLPRSIVVSLDWPDTAFTLLHEIGHLLDLCGIDRFGEFSSVSNPALDSWADAISGTLAFDRLLAMARTGSSAVVDEDGTLRAVSLTELQRATVDQLLLPEELWARSYAQYITERSRQTQLMLSLDRHLAMQPSAVYYPVQWASDDFAPIAATIDAIFTSKGWIA